MSTAAVDALDEPSTKNMDLLAINGVLLQHVAGYVQPDVLRLNRTLKTSTMGLPEAVWERACRTLGAGARPAAMTWREYYDSVMAPLARAVYAGDWSHATGTRALVLRLARPFVVQEPQLRHVLYRNRDSRLQILRCLLPFPTADACRELFIDQMSEQVHIRREFKQHAEAHRPEYLQHCGPILH